MYANVTSTSTLASKNRTEQNKTKQNKIKLYVSFFPSYIHGIKIVTIFKRIFEENEPKLTVHFTNHESQDFHKNQIPVLCVASVLLNHNTVTNIGSDLPLMKCHIFLIGNTHKGYFITIDYLCDHLIRALLVFFRTRYHVLA